MIKKHQGVPNKKHKKETTKEFIVNEPSGLLEFLLLNLSNLSRNNVKSLLLYREVFVDGTVITQYNYPLRVGQKIRINKAMNLPKEQQDELNIIYEDDDIIVINKPAGLLSIATDKEKEHTAYNMLTAYVRLSDPENRIFSIHRLDRDTSGVLMVAKNEKIKFAFQDNWANLVTQRRYVAIVEGKVSEKNGRIKSWLKETRTMLMYSSNVVGDGVEAITNYNVLKENADFSLLDISLETGRKNQIRVHMKDIGHNIVGDKKYGSKTNPLKRLCLHAYKLEIKHPFTNELMTFETPFPKAFNALLNSNSSAHKSRK